MRCPRKDMQQNYDKEVKKMKDNISKMSKIKNYIIYHFNF